MKRIRNISLIAITLIAVFTIGTNCLASNWIRPSNPSISIDGQTFSGMDTMMARSNLTLTLVDGFPVKIAWSMTKAPLATVANIQLVILCDGQEQWSYSINGDRNPVIGKLFWTPRVIEGSNLTYRIRVTWQTVLIGTEIATAQTPVFRIQGGQNRSINLLPPTSDAMINGIALINFTWSSTGLPADAKIKLMCHPVGDTSRMMEMTTTANSGGYLLWLGDFETPLPAGKYVVRAYYVVNVANSSSAFGLASNEVMFGVQDPVLAP